MKIEFIPQEAALVEYTRKPLERINEVARVCYQSKMPEDYEIQKQFVKSLINKGHESPLEFIDFTWFITTSRGIANELVRHRLASYMQESTRYINYENMQVIEPEEKKEAYSIDDITSAYGNAVIAYHELLEKGVSRQFARDILPLGLATKLWCKMNLREFRHFLTLRAGIGAHPAMRSLAKSMMNTLYDAYSTQTASTLLHNV